MSLFLGAPQGAFSATPLAAGFPHALLAEGAKELRQLLQSLAHFVTFACI